MVGGIDQKPRSELNYKQIPCRARNSNAPFLEIGKVDHEFAIANRDTDRLKVLQGLKQILNYI